MQYFNVVSVVRNCLTSCQFRAGFDNDDIGTLDRFDVIPAGSTVFVAGKEIPDFYSTSYSLPERPEKE